MSPFKVEIKNEEGGWEFASYAFNKVELSELINGVYVDRPIRIYWDGVLQLERDGANVIDFTIN